MGCHTSSIVYNCRLPGLWPIDRLNFVSGGVKVILDKELVIFKLMVIDELSFFTRTHVT